jgi:hypothetical protein
LLLAIKASKSGAAISPPQRPAATQAGQPRIEPLAFAASVNRLLLRMVNEGLTPVGTNR